MGCTESKNIEELKNTIIVDKVLKGKTALITGGNRGLGKEIVTLFAQQGANIVFNSSTQNPKADEFAKEISTRYGVPCYYVACDIRKEQEINNMVEFAREKFKNVDILINNAGKVYFGQVETLKVEDFNESMQTNFIAPMLFAKKCIPMMKEKKWGRIVNFTSGSTRKIMEGLCAYSAAKQGLECFSTTLAKEVGEFGITVNCISPGAMATDMYFNGIKGLGQMTNTEPDVIQQAILAPLCVKEVIDARKVAEHTLFLCSESARYQTGSTSMNDCGYTI